MGHNNPYGLILSVRIGLRKGTPARKVKPKHYEHFLQESFYYAGYSPVPCT